MTTTGIYQPLSSKDGKFKTNSKLDEEAFDRSARRYPGLITLLTLVIAVLSMTVCMMCAIYCGSLLKQVSVAESRLAAYTTEDHASSTLNPPKHLNPEALVAITEIPSQPSAAPVRSTASRIRIDSSILKSMMASTGSKRNWKNQQYGQDELPNNMEGLNGGDDSSKASQAIDPEKEDTEAMDSQRELLIESDDDSSDGFEYGFDQLDYDIGDYGDENEDGDGFEDELDDLQEGFSGDAETEWKTEEVMSDDEDDVSGSTMDSGVIEGIGGRTRRSAERKSQQNRGGKRNRKNRKEQTPSRRTDKKSKRDKKISLPVAQYIGSLTEAETRDLVDLQFDSYKNIETCRQIETMGGKLCLNRTFVPSTEPLNIFKTASWEGDKASPLDKHGSFFQAKSSGIHLVFAQIVFAGFDNVKSASIIQKRGETSIDSLNCYTGSFGEETKKQTCTIVGLLNIRRGDVIKLISNNKYAPVLRADGDTYFGVVQLTQQKSDKRS